MEQAAIPLIGRWRLEDQEVRIILGYITSFGIHEILYQYRNKYGFEVPFRRPTNGG